MTWTQFWIGVGCLVAALIAAAATFGPEGDR